MSDRRFAALVGIGAALAADGATYAGFDALRALFTRGHWVLYVYVGVFVFLATYCGAFVAWRLARRLPAAAPLPRGALLFLGFVAVYLTTGLGRIDSYDGEMMFRVDEAIVERQSLRISDEIFHASEPYAVYGLGTTLAALPFYVVGDALGADQRWSVSLLNSFVTAATVALLYFFTLQLGLGTGTGLFVAAAFGFGSLAWPYTRTFFSEPLVGLALLGAAAGARGYRAGGGLRPLAATGASLGAAVLIRDDSALAVPLFAAYAFAPERGRWLPAARAWLAFGAPLALLVGAALWYNDHRFGSLVGGQLERIGFQPTFTLMTFFTAAYGLTLSAGKGLLFYTPLVALSAIAWPLFHRRYRLECLLFTAVALERLAFFSLWPRWYGGVCWGPRFLVPLLPLLILPIGLLVAAPGWQSRTRRALVAGLFALSVLAQVPAVAIDYVAYYAQSQASGQTWEQRLFEPRYSPLAGQIRLVLAGQARDWLLPLPPGAPALPVRSVLIGVALAAALGVAGSLAPGRGASLRQNDGPVDRRILASVPEQA